MLFRCQFTGEAFPSKMTFDFYLCRSLKYEMCKTNPHTMEELGKNSYVGYQQFPGKNSGDLTTTSFACILRIFGEKNKYFCMYCRFGDFY